MNIVVLKGYFFVEYCLKGFFERGYCFEVMGCKMEVFVFFFFFY